MNVYNYCSFFFSFFFSGRTFILRSCSAVFLRDLFLHLHNTITVYLCYVYIYTYIIMHTYIYIITCQAAVFLPNPLVNNRLSLPRRVDCLLDLLLYVVKIHAYTIDDFCLRLSIYIYIYICIHIYICIYVYILNTTVVE